MSQSRPPPEVVRRKRWGRLAAVILFGAGVLGASTARAGSAALRRRWVPFAIEGTSMQPTLASGEFVIVDRDRDASPGDIVVVRRPDRPDLEIIKRVVTIETDRSLNLLGDHRMQSTDSRHFGLVPPENIVGVVRWRYWPPWRLHRYA